jgi:hypothetical protein
MKRLVVVGTCLVVLLIACGGSDNGSDGAADQGGAGGEATGETDKTTPKAPSGPRLEGTFKVKGEVVSASGLLADAKGDSVKREYTFDPVCASGPCDVRIEQETPGGTARGRLTLEGDTFTGTTSILGACTDSATGEVIHPKGFEGTYEHELQVVATRIEGDDEIVTKIRGTVKGSTRPAEPECEGTGRQTTEYTGTLS